MAAIDKIYIGNYDQYCQLRDWMLEQPSLKDKYGKSTRLIDYLWKRDESFRGGPIMSNPLYIDAVLIRTCPFDFIQDELKLRYGYISQNDIDERYNIVMNRTEENKDWYTWLKPEDFKVIDGIVTMPNLEKSDYEKIKDNELYTSPEFSPEEYGITDFHIGKHFKLVSMPKFYDGQKYNRQLNGKSWWVNVDTAENYPFIWYTVYNDKDRRPTWEFSSDFVTDVDYTSNTAHGFKTLKAVERMILKWKLPVGTVVRVTGEYVGEEYKYIVTK